MHQNMDEKPTSVTLKGVLSDVGTLTAKYSTEAFDAAKKLKPSTIKEAGGAAAGASLLGVVGTHVGIAALGTAISGVLPLAVVGGLAGWGVVHAWNHITAPKTEDNPDKETPNG